MQPDPALADLRPRQLHRAAGTYIANYVANTAPVANNDAYSVNEDGILTVAAPGVLANDTDANGQTLTAALVTGPSNGTLTLNADGSFTYTPNANYFGGDSFSYRANDGFTDSNLAAVSLTVNAVDDAPVAVNDSATVGEDSGATTIDVRANDTDIDGGPKTINAVTQPGNGTVAITNFGADLTYTPNANYCNGGSPTDNFTYTLNGGSTATVAVTVSCVDDAPAAVNDSATVAEDSAATTINVLANDTDIDGGPKTIASATDPANGSVTVAGDGLSLSYTPDANYCNGGSPTDNFTYTLNGGSTATVAVTVTCVNDAPVAVNNSYSTDEDTPLNVAAPGVLGNDTDVDGDTLSAVLVADVANGTLTLNADGSFDYQPDLNFNGSDSFTYKANDGTADSNVATVTITVNAVNDAPVCANVSITTDEDTAGSTASRLQRRRR